MPLIDFDDEAVWSTLYSVTLPDGRVAGFERCAKELILGDDHLLLLAAADLKSTDRVAVIGAGFGWVVEDWRGRGFETVVAVDTSSWIQANLAQNASVPVLAFDVTTPQGRDSIRAALGGSVDVVITEDVLPCLNDQECVLLCDALRILGDRVVHWVTVNATGMNSHDLGTWKNLVAQDRVVRRGSGEWL